MATFTLTGIKTFKSFDGGGYSATVRRDGKPYAEAFDDGNGGSVMFRRTEGPCDDVKELEEFCRQWAKTNRNSLLQGYLDIGCSPEEAAKLVDDPREPMATWAGREVDAQMQRQQLQRAARTKTLFRLKGDKADEWRGLKGKCTQAHIDHLHRTYADKLDCIFGVNP